MSRNGKILLAVLAGLLVLCACTVIGVVALGGLFFTRTVSTAPERVEQVAIQAGAPELPGFSPEWSVDLLGIKAVGYEAGSKHVIVAALPDAVHMDIESIEEQMRRAVRDREGYQWYNLDMTVVGKQTVKVAGQEVDAIVAEGGSNSGPYRQMSGIYQGQHGRTFFTIAGPIATWEEREVEMILSSLK